MRKIKLYIAASLDGYIARANGDLDWLTEYPNPDNSDHGYADFYNTVDTLIIGGRTYDSILGMNVPWPYEGKDTYIVTNHTRGTVSDDHLHFVMDNVIETLAELKHKDGKDIWLVGGGKLISMFMENDLIDEMILFYVPTILGDGIPLFPKMSKESHWSTVKCEKYNSGIMRIDLNKND